MKSISASPWQRGLVSCLVAVTLPCVSYAKNHTSTPARSSSPPPAPRQSSPPPAPRQSPPASNSNSRPSYTAPSVSYPKQNNPYSGNSQPYKVDIKPKAPEVREQPRPAPERREPAPAPKPNNYNPYAGGGYRQEINPPKPAVEPKPAPERRESAPAPKPNNYNPYTGGGYRQEINPPKPVVEPKPAPKPNYIPYSGGGYQQEITPKREEPQPRSSSETPFTRKNKDGTVTTGVRGPDGKVIKSERRDQAGNTLNTFERNDDGTTVSKNNRRGATTTLQPGGIAQTKYENGVTKTRTPRPDGTVLVTREHNGQRHQYRTRKDTPTVNNREVIVYERSHDSLWNNPWFVMWILSSNNRDHGHTNYGGPTGGYVGGGYRDGNGNYGGSSSPSSRATPSELKYDWLTAGFTYLSPAIAPVSGGWFLGFGKSASKVYKNPLDWLSDYILLELIDDHSSTKSWWGENYVYDLSIDIRNEIREEALETAARLSKKEDLAIRTHWKPEDGSPVNTTLYIVDENGGMSVNRSSNEEICTINAGDILLLKKHIVGTERVEVSIRHSVETEDTDCEKGDVVYLRIDQLQQFYNEFASRVERGLAKGALVFQNQ